MHVLGMNSIQMMQASNVQGTFSHRVFFLLKEQVFLDYSKG